MNMLTKVVGASYNEVEINSVIKKMQNEGWYLRGTPILVGNHPVMTFEKPEDSSSYMNMLTKVNCLNSQLLDDINDEIEKMQKQGWYLRGTPTSEDYPTILTFERPENDKSEKTSE